ERLVFTQPKRAHVTPLLIELHWLPSAARIKFKSLMLAYRVLAGSAPTYLNVLLKANVTPRTLRSSSERRLALPSVQARQSRLFSFVVPRSEEHTSELQSHLNIVCRLLLENKKRTSIHTRYIRHVRNISRIRSHRHLC